MTRRTEAELWAIAEQQLTAKQLKVMRYWLDGQSFRNIGITLNISESTARGHLDRAFRRMRPLPQKGRRMKKISDIWPPNAESARVREQRRDRANRDQERANGWLQDGTFFRSWQQNPWIEIPTQVTYDAMAALEQRIADLEAH